MKNHEHSFVAYKCHNSKCDAEAPPNGIARALIRHKDMRIAKRQFYGNYIFSYHPNPVGWLLLCTPSLAWLLACSVEGDNRKQFKESLISRVIYLAFSNFDCLCIFYECKLFRQLLAKTIFKLMPYFRRDKNPFAIGGMILNKH